jgi:site-specific recombinase XerD
MALFSVTVRPYADRRKPHLKFVLRVRHPDRKVERYFYETKKKAEADAATKGQDVENLGVRALALDLNQKVEALSAFERLRVNGASLTEAVDYFLRSRENSTVSVHELCARYIASREQLQLSKRYLSTLRGTLGRFTERLGAKRATEFRPEDAEDWLHGLKVGAVSVNSYRRLLHAVFQYATDRKRIKENPIALVELIKETPEKVGILTVEHMATLLAAAREPDVLATIAIGGFAGLRPEEIARLKWSAIDLEQALIDCGADLTKTAKSRYVKIEPVLAAWLRWCCLKEIGRPELIQAENFRRRFDIARRTAGFRLRGPQEAKENGEPLSAEEMANLDKSRIPWPHDALRHSYASYHIAKFQDAAALALQMGHTTTKLIFSNYRHRVKLSEAEAWWGLMPLPRH